MDKRTKAREIAMQALFQLDVQGDRVLDCIDGFIKENCQEELSEQLAREWCMGTRQHIAECDRIIEKAAPRWRIQRIELLERNILRLSCYQLLKCSEIPSKVVINEAIEMAKRYGSARSPAFVNGVMDAVHRIINEEKRDAKTPDIQSVSAGAEIAQ
ncbi:putative N utilization substance protein B [Limihaloglobus sulfuriphilus]|uniref:Transcription antitermination protein NusB n=1 Tax=Limihaloglobus sulfuriphilus TaxID=1851148 RepID=A0A1Q2MEW2_9BACT|nr:transcription antitermination factor NusB [Limihaloglobus sulfuriphilus]AQQ71194.1 putative N utilization substance protein B [Limihaloglobus sulfuriphilus]